MYDARIREALRAAQAYQDAIDRDCAESKRPLPTDTQRKSYLLRLALMRIPLEAFEE